MALAMNSKTRRAFFRISVLSGNFFAPIYVIYLLGLDLSYFEISVLHILKEATGFLLEIPSGIFSDLNSRSRSLSLAGILLAVASVSFGLGRSFLSFIPAFVLWGASYAFVSGTDVAIAHVTSTSPAEFSRTVSTMTALRRTSSAVSQTTGPLLYSLSAYLPFAVSAISALLQARESSTLRAVESSHANRSVRDYLRSIRTVMTRSRLFLVMLGYSILTSTTFALFVFQQPKLVNAGLPVAGLSIAFAIIFLASLLATILARRIRANPGGGPGPVVAIAILVASIFGLSRAQSPVPVLLYMVVQTSILSVVVQQRIVHLNNLFSDENRSGLLSTQSLINNVLQAILVLLTGWVADSRGIDSAILVLCFAPLLLVPVSIASSVRSRRDS
jgi:hypothetical protein